MGTLRALWPATPLRQPADPYGTRIHVTIHLSAADPCSVYVCRPRRRDPRNNAIPIA